MNSWVKILEGFRNGAFPNYNYGLTPRFILGVCQIPIGQKIESEQIAKFEMEKMFSEMMIYNNMGLIVTSNHCEIHNGPVMSFIDSKWSETSIGTTFEIIWNRYGTEIIEGDFHINQEENKIVEKLFSYES
ncbi:MAG TPA: hypothetical protein PKD16_19455 [Saprospiraceae bacterium]|jgi:hypothetical protein|nr:hypothetical protein [Saprospiraceae bacterium]HMT72351.1 hypothetical protein [Saprospiraceae bacterium]